MSSSHFEKCKSNFENVEKHWVESYEKIIDFSVVKKMIEIASLVGSRKTHVFCQRALQDLNGSINSVDGHVDQETIDAINFTVRSGLSKQFKMTVAHYAANYIQLKVSPSEYSIYLKKLFK